MTHIAWTVERWLGTQGYAADEPCEEDQDDDANGVLLSASVAGRVALGVRAGAKVRRLQQHRREDGLLVLTLRKPYANGTTDFIFSEVELAQRLAALVPPKGKNGISYHGVFGASR